MASTWHHDSSGATASRRKGENGKIMQFQIENISEDSFYLNLLLGLPKLLSTKLRRYGVKRYHLKRLPPASEEEIRAWQAEKNVLLPADLKRFYLSTNGFQFRWVLPVGRGEQDIEGCMEVKKLQDLVPTTGAAAINQVWKDGSTYRPNFGHDVKLFELARLKTNHSILLVFSGYHFTNHVLLKTQEEDYHYLSPDFSSYLRISIAHLCLPYWQLLKTPQGPPQWVLNLIRYMAPHLLLKEDLKKVGEVEDDFVNTLDVGIFKVNAEEDRKGGKKKVEKERAGVLQFKRAFRTTK